jgi:hypothetical protein
VSKYLKQLKVIIKKETLLKQDTDILNAQEACRMITNKAWQCKLSDKEAANHPIALSLRAMTSIQKSMVSECCDGTPNNIRNIDLGSPFLVLLENSGIILDDAEKSFLKNKNNNDLILMMIFRFPETLYCLRKINLTQLCSVLTKIIEQSSENKYFYCPWLSCVGNLLDNFGYEKMSSWSNVELMQKVNQELDNLANDLNLDQQPDKKRWLKF